jgi:hypothetical protein
MMLFPELRNQFAAQAAELEAGCESDKQHGPWNET